MNGEALLRRAAALVSPRARRWRRLLASCDLDPDVLPGPVEQPGARDFIICGSPRSGTTLVAAMLFQPPTCVTVMEPWDGLRLPPAALFASLRDELARGSLRRGKLDVAALRATGAVEWQAEGAAVAPVTVDDDFLLGVKWPGFWRYLEHLADTKFLVCVRDPVEVIASYAKVGGRLGQGLEYDVALHRRMNAELTAASDDPAERRVLLHDYVTARLAPHLGRPNVFVVRYERWFTDPDAMLAEIGDFLGACLRRPPGRVAPDPPRHGLTEREVARIRRLCRTFATLGYEAPAAVDGP